MVASIHAAPAPAAAKVRGVAWAVPAPWHRVLWGAGAGAAATAAMSVAMSVVRRAGVVDKLAPRLVVESAMRRTAWSGSRAARPMTAIAHLGFGIGNGVVFGLVARRLPGPRLVKGLTFAAVVLLASYEGWVPAARMLAPLHRQRRDRIIELVAGHAVYGIVLGRLAG